MYLVYQDWDMFQFTVDSLPKDYYISKPKVLMILESNFVGILKDESVVYIPLRETYADITEAESWVHNFRLPSRLFS